MDSSESISLSMDTTSDSVDVVGHFKQDIKKLTHHSSNQNQPPIFKAKKYRQKRPRTILLNGNNLNYHDEETISTNSSRLPPDKRKFCIVDETPPSSTSSIALTNDCSQSKPRLSHHLSNHLLQSTSSPVASSLATFMSCCSETSSSSTSSRAFQKQRKSTVQNTNNIPSQGKKSVLFDKVTVYHFNRSQGFSSVPAQGGATLGMKRKHFLRRRLSVDLYEEVRRRSRRQILLKIHIEKRKQEEQLLQHQPQQRPDSSSQSDIDVSSYSQANALNSKETANNSNALNITMRDKADTKSDTKVIDVIGDGNDDEEDEETYSDYSDISDSELESDSYIFLQPLDVKLRRSLLRASGVCRIDPVERKECKKIRDSRDRSGCKCVGQCIPEYCECSRLGVKCHVDRVSFPCGCNAVGCKNPEGRTEFDKARVRKHYVEKIMETHNQLSSNEDELTATTPPSSSSSEESC